MDEANKADAAQQQKQLDAAQMDNATAEANQAAQQMMGQQAASAEMYSQLKLQAMGSTQSAAAGPESLPPDQRDVANNIAGTVMTALRANMSSMQGQTSGGGGGEEQEGLRAQTANMGINFGGSDSFGDAADKKIQDAAKVAVYRDIVDMLNGMENKRQTKGNIQEAISAYDQLIAARYAGKGKDAKVSMPVFEMDEKTGKMKKVGMREMTKEEAEGERNKLKDKKDSISEMGEMDMLLLQQMMEKKNQLETMISNVMKAGYEGGQAAIQALKAS
ncbi:MAG: hypothetical protein IT381_13130 [Deltaproteobacteria bacterium]|nr:hypothetical protein [Deltaproteobacteria bacterium]